MSPFKQNINPWWGSIGVELEIIADLNFRTFNQGPNEEPKEPEPNITFKVPKSDWKPKLKPVRRRHNDYLTRRNCFDNDNSRKMIVSTCYMRVIICHISYENYYLLKFFKAFERNRNVSAFFDPINLRIERTRLSTDQTDKHI